MEEIKNNPRSTKKQQSLQFIDEIEAIRSQELPVFHSGLLLENHVNRSLAREGIEMSDDRYENHFRTYFDFSRISPNEALPGKNGVAQLKILQEHHLYLSQQLLIKQGLNAKKVLKVWEKYRPWIFAYTNIMEKIYS